MKRRRNNSFSPASFLDSVRRGKNPDSEEKGFIRSRFVSGVVGKEPVGSYSAHTKLTGSRQEQIACGLRPKTSNRWLPDPNLSTKVRTRGIPLIDNGGHFLGSCVTTLRSSSAGYFTTMVARTLDVLKRRVHYRGNKSCKYTLDFLTRLSCFYNITLNDYALERILRCNVKFSRRLLEKFSQRMDDQKRFLYGQICLHISWLKSRGSSIPRVKSIKKTYIAEYRSFDIRNYGIQRYVVEVLNWLGDPWIVGPLKLR